MHLYYKLQLLAICIHWCLNLCEQNFADGCWSTKSVKLNYYFNKTALIYSRIWLSPLCLILAFNIHYHPIAKWVGQGELEIYILPASISCIPIKPLMIFMTCMSFKFELKTSIATYCEKFINDQQTMYIHMFISDPCTCICMFGTRCVAMVCALVSFGTTWSRHTLV